MMGEMNKHLRRDTVFKLLGLQLVPNKYVLGTLVYSANPYVKNMLRKAPTNCINGYVLALQRHKHGARRCSLRS